MQSVIYSNFNDLRRKKAAAESRDISIRTVARETGLAMTTLLRISKNDDDVQNVRLSTVNVLCKYFGVGVGEIVEFRAD